MFLTLTWFLVFPTAFAARSPVEKVVELITELKAKIEMDGANEQKIYDKYACWCETTTQRKADSIDYGKETIGKTTQQILSLKSAITGLSNEIAELQGKIAENEASMKQLTVLREKENSDWQQEKTQAETALNSLSAAINVLRGAGTGGDMGLFQVAVGVRNAVLHASKLNKISEENAQLIRSFLENPDYLDQKAQAKQSYSPQSATVQGILVDMYSTFASELQEANQEESDKQMEFEGIIAEKEKEIAFWKSVMAGKEATKADKEQALAMNEEKLEETQIQLKEDEAFFESARTACQEKSDEWDERSRLRTEELAGINKALKLLTSDKARAIFSNATKTRPIDTFGSEGVVFVEVGHSTTTPNEIAFRQLKAAASSTKSLRLAAIAASVKVSTEGHFDAVISAIDTMVETLKAEETSDIEQRDWCIADRHENTQSKNKLEHDIKVLEAKIQKLENAKAQMEEDIATTTQNKVDLEAAMAEALADRNAENAAFTTAKSDDVNAIALLESAIAALSEFGENNLSLLQQPVFSVSEDQAPDATFSSSAKYTGASNGIVGLLMNIKESLEKEVNVATKSETNSQNNYRALYTESMASIRSYNTTIDNLEAAVSETEGHILTGNEDKTDATDKHTAVLDYLQRIKGNCDWIMSAFEKRAAARKVELEGLGTAKSTLAGAQGGEFGFLQKSM